MRTMIAGAVALGLAGPAVAQELDEVTLQLQWVTQAQFAGYYVAKDRGFYEEEGLDVTIKPGGPDIAPPQVLAGGGADVMLNWMPSALAAREKGLPVVNIAQPFKSSGLMLTCWKDTGIESPDDFRGKTIGVWFFGNEYPFLSWMSQEGIPTDGGEDGVTVLKQAFNVDPLLQRQADCISTMTYNEYGQVLDAGVSEDELVTFKYEDQGVATLEDGLYVLEDDPVASGLCTADDLADLAGGTDREGGGQEQRHQGGKVEVGLGGKATERIACRRYNRQFQTQHQAAHQHHTARDVARIEADQRSIP